jgi:Zn-dependent peptidase ImmA (M78 family)/transcriptional regulator with XRE-family HTH domain
MRSDSTFNAEMLTLARESRNLTQGELAELSGLSQGYISKAENGIIEPDKHRLGLLSQALHYPPEFFLRGGRAYGYGSPCLRYRKRQSLPMKRVRHNLALMNVLRMQVEQLIKGVEIQSPIGFPRFDIDEFGSPTAIAQLVRAQWRLPHGPVRNLVRTVEAAGGIVILCSFGTDRMDAVSQWPEADRPYFLLNKDAPGDRQRLTLAHEIGHMVMNQWPSANQEDEAYEFARELLMPADEIRDDLRGLDLKRLYPLKSYWRVSMQVLIYQAGSLGLISERQQRSLFARLSELGYKKTEPAPIEAEQPALIHDIVEFHLTEHGYDVNELSRLVCLEDAEFRMLYLGEKHPPRLRTVEDHTG